jgi:hypothetical protein
VDKQEEGEEKNEEELCGDIDDILEVKLLENKGDDE